jgi:DNA ligase-1
MTFKDLSIYLQKLEKITSRNEMVVILAELFSKVPADEIDKVIYLLQGRVSPLYENVEFNIAEKSMVKAIALAYGKNEQEVSKEYKKVGDLGELAEACALKTKNQNPKTKTISEVFEALKLVTDTGGAGSVEKKLSTLSELLKSLDGNSARFVSRIPVNKLRLGFSDMTVIDSLSWMLKGDKSFKKEIEKKYNMRPDLGFIAHSLKENGIKGIESVKPAVFTPILMARAERLSSGKEIIEKIGKCAVEPKFDGFRLQIHFNGNGVKIFTRNLEEVTFMYPDIEKGIREQIKEKEVILEGEAIAYNPDTNEYLPFQLTAQRKRKYDIPEMARKIPLKYMAFDLLYLNGKNYVPEIYEMRRKALAKIINKGKTVYLAEEEIFDEGGKIENFFDECISEGLEGILAKRLDGVYQAGARGWNWIKLKRSYQSKLNDTVDCVVMGYYYGRGKRTAFGIGAFLIGVYDEKEDKFVTIAKVGTGLMDVEWKELAKRGQKLKAKEKPPLYEVDKWLEPDVWIESEIVVEIKADELTRSPVHTAGRVMKASKSGSAFDVDIPGYALRFPRLERFRDDKKPTDATTLSEVEKMFKLQKK